MPKQIIRLLIAFVLFVSLFLVIKHFLTPKSFGKYGHYRTDALVNNASRELNYADNKDCIECHDDIDKTKKSGAHKSINCQSCHGPGSKHVADPDKNLLFKPEAREFCGKCHNKIEGRPTSVITQVDLNEHYPDGKCIECHIAHNPTELK
jgi:hypothetical protein